MSKEKEQHIRQFEAGQYLQSIRKEQNKTLRAVAQELEISYPYLSEIEKGIKVPSDTVLEKIAKCYGIDEDELYMKYGKIPTHFVTQIEESKELQRILSAVSKKKKLKDEEKEQYKNDLTKVFKDFMDSIENP